MKFYELKGGGKEMGGTEGKKSERKDEVFGEGEDINY